MTPHPPFVQSIDYFAERLRFGGGRLRSARPHRLSLAGAALPRFGGAVRHEHVHGPLADDVEALALLSLPKHDVLKKKEGDGEREGKEVKKENRKEKGVQEKRRRTEKRRWSIRRVKRRDGVGEEESRAEKK
jgi:hypothetical protein